MKQRADHSSRWFTTRNLLVSALLLITVLANGACRGGVASGVTCEDIRALNLGMSREDVRKIMSDPLGVAIGDEYGVDGERWRYSTDPGALRLFVDVDRTGVTQVSAYYMYFLDEGSTELYFLTPEAHYESPEFEDYVSCR